MLYFWPALYIRVTTNRTAFNTKLRANGYTAEDLRRFDLTRRRRRPRRTHPEGPFYYLDLPFLGEGAERRIRRAFAREGVNVRLYRRSTTILDTVRPKRQELRQCSWPACPTSNEALCFVKNCVYEITCTPCGCSYVGSTTRPLHERIREHTVIGRGSTVHQHFLRCGQGNAQVHVAILAREKDEVNTRLREAIIIKKRQPQLNTRIDSDLAALVF